MGETELEEVLILQRAIAITTNAYDEPRNLKLRHPPQKKLYKHF